MDNIDDIVNEYNNTCHRTIKMMLIFVKNNAYIDFDKEVNFKDPKFQVGPPNWPEEIFVIKIIENTVSWTYNINDLRSCWDIL